MSQDQDNLVKIGKGATSLSKDLEKLSDRRSERVARSENVQVVCHRQSQSWSALQRSG